MTLFRGFLGFFCPKYGSALLTFWQEVVSYDKDSVWTIFENFLFKKKRDVPKVYSFGPILGPMLVKEFLL